jgi:hypothetical protein
LRLGRRSALCAVTAGGWSIRACQAGSWTGAVVWSKFLLPRTESRNVEGSSS